MALAGCGGSAAAKPKLKVVAQVGATATATPAPDPGAEAAAGRMAAAARLLDMTDTSVNNAISALSQALPESAQADLADARGQLARSRHALGGYPVPGGYRSAAVLLGHGLTAYSKAAAECLRHADRCQTDTNAGHADVTRAKRALRHQPEAGQPATLAAEIAALRVPRTIHRKASVPHHHVVHHVLIAAAAPSATAVPGVRVVYVLIHSTPLPLPTVAPFVVVPRPPVTPRHTDLHRVTVPIRHVKPVLSASVLAGDLHAVAWTAAPLHSATASLQQGVAYLRGLGVNPDPRSTSEVVNYVDLATGDVQATGKRITLLSRRFRDPRSARRLQSALRLQQQTITELRQASTDAGANRSMQAQIELGLAGSDARALSRVVSRVGVVLRKSA